MSSELTFHPFADIFPLIEGDELNALAGDIIVNGLHDPIVLHDGQILDGRNRYRACLRMGVEPAFVTYEGDSPLRFVISKNLSRRHLTESQRAMVGAQLATLQDGQRQVGQLADVPTQEEAAELMSVGERSVRRARTVLTHGTPDQIEAVKRGEKKVSKAAKEIAEKTQAEPPEQTAEDSAEERKEHYESLDNLVQQVNENVKAADECMKEATDACIAGLVESLRGIQGIINTGKHADTFYHRLSKTAQKKNRQGNLRAERKYNQSP